MGTMVNIACEPSLFEELEWQARGLFMHTSFVTHP